MELLFFVDMLGLILAVSGNFDRLPDVERVRAL